MTQLNNVTVTRKRTKGSLIKMSISFDAERLGAKERKKIYYAYGRFLIEVLSTDELVEFLRQLDGHRKAIAKKPRGRK